MTTDRHWVWDDQKVLQEVELEPGHRPEVLAAIGVVKMYLDLENKAMEACEPSTVKQYEVYVEAAVDTLHSRGFL